MAADPSAAAPLDARFWNSATLNEQAQVTVPSNAPIDAVVTVTTTQFCAFGSCTNYTWGSTSWEVNGLRTCVNHANHTNAGPVSEAFTVTAPAIVGTYDVIFTNYSDDACSVSGTPLTLSGAIIVDTNATLNGRPVVTAPANLTVDGLTPVAVNLGSFTDDAGPWTVTVNWGDGSANTVFTATATGSLGTQNHSFVASGARSASVTVTDGGGRNHSATFQVTVNRVAQTVGDGTATSCTESALAQALAVASTLAFNCGSSPVTITFTSMKTITGNITIDGGGLITFDGGNSVRPLWFNSGVVAELKNLTITRGYANQTSVSGGAVASLGSLTVTNSTFISNASGSGGSGGAISVEGALFVTGSTFNGNSGTNGGAIALSSSATANPSSVVDSTFTSNTSTSGGAIYFYTSVSTNSLGVLSSTFLSNTAQNYGGAVLRAGYGPMTITNSTFVGNSATTYSGGAISAQGTAGSSFTITNSTFSGNNAAAGGAAIGRRDVDGEVTVRNSIVANSTTGTNCWGTITNGGNNVDSASTCGFGSTSGSLSNTDPVLGSLASIGGPTQTMALLDGSPAINAGSATVCAAAAPSGPAGKDQRGFNHKGVCDIGAYEVQVSVPTAASDSYAVARGATLTVGTPGLLANDVDADGGTLIATRVSGPSRGTLTLNPNGAFAYLHDGTSGPGDSFTYRASNGTMSSGVTTVSIAAYRATPPPALPRAWGWNQYSQLGDGSATDRNSPVAPSTLANVVAVAAGGQHSLAIASDGTVWSWGWNTSGQVGDGSTTQRTTPVPVIDLTNVVALAAGSYYSLALKGDGTVWGWGDNGSGQLGDGSTVARSSPVRVGSLSAISAISTGANHALALRADGTVWAWGYNFRGQLGDSSTATRTSPVQVSGLTGAIAVAAGGQHSLAVKADGTTWAWGQNFFGQLGDGTTTDRWTPVQAPSLTGAASVSAGNLHSLGLKSDGTVWAWGYNEFGRLGDGSTADRWTPVRSGTLTGITAVAAGDYHTVALQSNGVVWTWGGNQIGQLGDQTNTNRSSPGQVSGGIGGAASAISTTSYHTLAVVGSPSATNDAYTTDEDTRLTVAAPGILANDVSQSGLPLSVVRYLAQPYHCQVCGDSLPSASFSLSSDGSFSYLPASGFIGSDFFTYEVTDGYTSSTARVDIAINRFNSPPVANDGAFTTNEDTAIGINLSALASDGETAATNLSYVIDQQPLHGTLGQATFDGFPDPAYRPTYYPAANYNGTDSFAYHVVDRGDPDNCGAPSASCLTAKSSAVKTVAITVTPMDDPPVVATNVGLTVAEGANSVIANTLLRATDADGTDPALLVFTLQRVTANGTLTKNVGFFSTSDNVLNAGDTFTQADVDQQRVKYWHGGGENPTDSFASNLWNGKSAGMLFGVVFSISITPVNDPPTATNDAYTTNEDTTLTMAAPGVLANDVDVDSPTLTASLVSGPSHGTLVLNADGSFTYAPAANFFGSDSFAYQASDGQLTSGTAQAFVAVLAVNDPPIAVSDAYTVVENQMLSVPGPGAAPVLANDSDIDGGLAAAVLGTGPAHASTFSLGSSGGFFYQPNANFNGVDTFTYYARDDVGALSANPATVTITVTPVNSAPTASDWSATTNEDTPVVIDLGALVSDAETADADLTYVIDSGPTHGSLSGTGSTRTYTPDANYFGSDSFTYHVVDRGDPDNCGTAGTLCAAPQSSAVKTVYLYVNSVNDAPSFAALNALTVVEGFGGLIDSSHLRATDVESNAGDLVFTIEQAPARGQLEKSSGSCFFNCTTTSLGVSSTFSQAEIDSGLLYYRHFGGEESTDFFRFSLSDGTATMTGQYFTVIVTPVNDPPVANNDSYSVNEDTTLTVAAPGVLANDTDPDGPSMAAELVTWDVSAGPFHGIVTLNPNGSFTYQPSADYYGADLFTYHVWDGSGYATNAYSANVTVSITVNPVNDAPTANPQSLTTREGAPLAVTLTGFDPEGDPLSFVISQQPTHGTLTDTGANRTYTPATGFSGVDSFLFQVIDTGGLMSASATVSITVTAAPTATPTQTPTPTLTATPSPTATLTSTPSPTLVPTATPTASLTATQVPTATSTPTATATPTPSVTATTTGTPTPTRTPSPTLASTPASGLWTMLQGSGAPSARHAHTAAWTGAEMIVWGGKGSGGSLGDGARYDPSTNAWTALPSTGAPSARGWHTATWTGTEMIVWGGEGSSVLGDGARYNANTNSWTGLPSTGAPSGRHGHTAVWTGTEMLIWGGNGTGGDAWGSLGNGARHNPGTNSWTPISSTGAPSARQYHTAVWTGTDMIVWGGYHSVGGQRGDGARYNPSTDTWTALPSTGAPGGRVYHRTAWTGTEMIVWGGEGSAGGQLGDGARYNPSTNIWTGLPSTGAPSARRFHTMVWTGSEIVVWGGDASGLPGDGARYNPSTNTWTTLSTTGAPGGRYMHSAVWTGSEMIVWGGDGAGGSPLGDGARYSPSDTTPTPTPSSTPTSSPTVTATPTTSPTPSPTPGGVGLLRLYTDPAVATTIKIDGVARNDWGLDWLKLPAGSYTLSFGDVAGFTSPTTLSVKRCNPSCGAATDQSVTTAITIRAGETTEVRAAFAAQGFLRATTEGGDSPTASMDGYPANEWGFWVAMPGGHPHTVSFEPGVGPNRPCSAAVSVSAGATTRIHGNYTTGSCAVTTSGLGPTAGSARVVGPITSPLGPGRAATLSPTPRRAPTATPVPRVTPPAPIRPATTGTGLLRVYSDPAVASTIFIDGFHRNDWGLDWLELTPGIYTLSFSGVAGFVSPTTISVRRCNPNCGTATDQAVTSSITVRAGETTEVRVPFAVAAFLRITTEGGNSPTVSIDGYPANEWGAWVALAPGIYTVSFENGAGTNRPCDRTVTVMAAATVRIHGNYTNGTCNLI